MLPEELLPLVRILLILLGGIAVWLLGRFLIRRFASGLVLKFAKPKASDQTNGEQAERMLVRGRTIAKVADRFLGWTITVVLLVTTLAELGIDVAALLGVTAILGAAIGFGAQHMVRDFISGLFIVIEDQYGVGDWVQIGSINGRVERVGMRITEVRDLGGTLWFIRNGEINQVGNFSHQWANALLDVSFPQKLPVSKCEALLRAVAEQMAKDPVWRDKIAAEIEVLGVQGITSGQLTLRAVLRTKPAEQWAVAREFRKRLLATAKRSRIEILATGR